MKKTVSAGGVVVNLKGEVLVVNQNNNSWSLPKGHVDKGEDLVAAAQREIYEESGVSRLSHVKKLGVYSRYKISLGKDDKHTELKTIHIFLFKTDQKILRPIDPKNPEALWVSKDKVAALLTHPKDQEFFNSIIDQI
jgi:ADP-ribose pyrophosphatase YjhB (NUDIX family)